MKIAKIGFLLICLSIAPLTTFAGQVQFSQEIKVTDFDIDANPDPKICVSSNNKIYIVWIENDDRSDHLYFSRSQDGGLTFEEKREIESNGDISGDPRIGVDSHGRIYIMYKELFDHLEIRLILKTSDDDGESFQTSTIATAGILRISLSSEDMKIIDDTIYYLMDDYLLRSTDGGNNFQIISILEDEQNTVGTVHSSSFAIDSHQNIFVVYYKGRPDSDIIDVCFAKMESGNDYFSESIVLEECDFLALLAIYKPSIIATSAGELYVFWNNGPKNIDDLPGDRTRFPAHYTYSNDMGSTFSQIDEITFDMQPSSLKTQIMIFEAYADQNDDLHFLYQYFDGLFYGKSSDLCTTFDKSIKLSTEGFWSDMEINGNGEIYMVWEESTNLEENEPGHIYFTKSIEGNASDNNDTSGDSGGDNGDGNAGGGCFISNLGPAQK